MVDGMRGEDLEEKTAESYQISETNLQIVQTGVARSRAIYILKLDYGMNNTTVKACL